MDKNTYTKMYQESIDSPDTFWSSQARSFLEWYKEWNSVIGVDKTKQLTRWFSGGSLNVSFNCIDRHVLNGQGDTVAYFWERSDGSSKQITYAELLDEVSRFANVLKSKGVKKGDRVCIYMPMTPEAVYAMLACTRIGAVHSVVFGGFSSEALRTRIEDAGCKAVVTADYGYRGNSRIELKKRVDDAVSACKTVSAVFVVRTTDEDVATNQITYDYRSEVSQMSPECIPEHMDAEDPLFILYTSGSTGVPKGVLHTTAGYLLYTAMTFKYVLDYKKDDVYWCAADIGWITGHSYIVYGPLCNGATSVLFEGIPTYPDAGRYWEIVDKYKVNIFYSTPTAIRMLMAQGNALVERSDRSSLRILGTVGEPINPEAWHWYNTVVGNGQCHIVDTWWQTETGGHAIAPLPGVVTPKPGAAMIPFFGIHPVVVDDDGTELEGAVSGNLVLKGEWPGKLRTLYNNHKRFTETYLAPYPGYYYTGDGVRRDADGDLWVTGRIDDVLNIAGRLVGTAEVESALVSHPCVAEAAVVAVPDEIKGSAVCAFVTPMVNANISEEEKCEMTTAVREQVGSFAKPEIYYVVPALPKTRSGKIMRRVLRKIVDDDTESLGDISTLADESVVEVIKNIRKNDSSR